MAAKKQKPELVEISIPPEPDYVGVIRLAVSGIATRMNFSIEEIEDIKIAVSEACTNAVQYAYEKTSDKNRVHVKCILHDKQLEIQVSDTGKGFDVKAVETPAIADVDTKSERPNLGLGITFIKSLMDQADFSSELGKGTTVTMAKTI
ncbi:hypothetical protein DID77_00975 [Candidatus Marinamargulisbacteria bacterium SCGC AG-439-L15]|nr:hypothetical protein DID77_00975 [Candidatus Marinamargulisbacteria bacterium SCGC AG-439-L15]